MLTIPNYRHVPVSFKSASRVVNCNYKNSKQPAFGHIHIEVGKAVGDLIAEENACAYSNNREGVKKALIKVLDKIKETGSDTGKILGEKLAKLCKEYGIEYKN